MCRCPCEYTVVCLSVLAMSWPGDSSRPHLHTMTAEVNSLSARQEWFHLFFLWFCRHHKAAAASLLVQSLLCRVSKTLVFLFKGKVTHIHANWQALPSFRNLCHLIGTVKYSVSVATDFCFIVPASLQCLVLFLHIALKVSFLFIT